MEAGDGTRTTNRTVKTGIDRVSIKRTTKRRVMQITQVEETIKGTQRTKKKYKVLQLWEDVALRKGVQNKKCKADGK